MTAKIIAHVMSIIGVVIGISMLTSITAALADDMLIDRGRVIFLQETFGGNGRTCATCHRPENNYTIDPTYISGLPPSDPLFVAEWNPTLLSLEHPRLLRGLALISVHSDGYDKPGVLRAVPSLSGLSQSMPPSPEIGRSAALGASGDGAPAGGSLRDFIVGAVVEHLPKTLARMPDSDFRYPTEEELSALEAFILSLSSPVEFDIARLTFTSLEAEQGRQLFLSEKSGPCTDCHHNAGALDAAGVNGLFDIGIQHRIGSSGLLIDPAMPADAGFGAETANVIAAGKVGFGDGRFNPPSLVQAADTVPLFHDNSAMTLEAAIHFYMSPDFVHSVEGRKRVQRDMDADEIRKMAAFLRTISAIENIRSAEVLSQKVLVGEVALGRELIVLASAETEDAFRNLYGSSGIYPTSIRLLFDALILQRQAMDALTVPARDGLVESAVAKLNEARALMTR